MKTRIISSLIMVPLVLVLFFRGIPLALVALIASGIAMWELFKGFSNIGTRANIFIGWGALILLYLIHFLVPGRHEFVMGWIVLSLIVSIMGIYNLEKHRVEDALVTVFGIIYIGFFIYHLVMIDESSLGIMVWLVAITAIFTDTCAYFTGYYLGKHKLCPNLSPKKTIEGAIGGILGSVIGCVIFGLISKVELFPHMILIGVLGSVFAQLGDLSASALKRKMGIKDYGDLIPGHGGVLDRIDSFIFTAPLVYYYLMLVISH